MGGATSHTAKISNVTSKLTIHEFSETFNPVVSSVPWISPYPLSIKTVVKTKKEVVPYQDQQLKFSSGGRRQGPVIKVVKKSNSSSGSRRKEEPQSQESKNQK